MAETDVALAEALQLYQPGWLAPDTSAFMRRQLSELVDIEPDPDPDDEDDFVVDDHAWVTGRPSGTEP